MSSPLQLEKKSATASNVLELTRDNRRSKEASQGYRQMRHMMIAAGIVLVFLGAVFLAIERVNLETTENDTLSFLAYFYNSTLVIGAALLSAVAFHSLSKRKEEIRRIIRIQDRQEEIKIIRVNLLKEMEE